MHGRHTVIFRVGLEGTYLVITICNYDTYAYLCMYLCGWLIVVKSQIHRPSSTPQWNHSWRDAHVQPSGRLVPPSTTYVVPHMWYLLLLGLRSAACSEPTEYVVRGTFHLVLSSLSLSLMIEIMWTAILW